MKKGLSIPDGIFLLKYLSDGSLAMIDQKSTVRIIDIETLKIIDGFKSNQVHEHRILNIVDISLSGKYTLIGLPGRNKAVLYLTKEKKLKATFGQHKGEVETVAISDDEVYLATGGTDGQTFVYHTGSSTPLVALRPHGDYITSISFTPDSSIVAFGSFDKTITVKNISLMSDDFVLKGHSAPIKKLMFLSSQFLLAADKEGSVVIWDLHTRMIKVRLPKMLEEILDITLSEDKHLLFVSTIYGNIGLYDLRSFERISLNYLKVRDRVNALTIDHKRKILFYGTQEGKLGSESLSTGDNELVEAMENKDFVGAYKLLEENILLGFSDYYSQLEELWETTLSEAKEFFVQGLYKEGVATLAPFASVPGKRALVKKVSAEFVEFQKFKKCIKDRKYALAYSLAYKYTMYQETQEFAKLENIWELQFAKAKKAILTKAGDDKVRKYLVLFRGVPQKAKLITDLFNQRKVFMLFRTKLTEKAFLDIFELVKAHPFLKEFKEYKDLQARGDALYHKIQLAYQTQDYVTAIKYANLIKDFPDFKDEVQTLTEHAQVYIDFKEAVDSKNLNKVYELFERNSFLAHLPGLKGLDPDWDDILSKIDTPMSEGNMHDLLALLKPYPYASHKKRHIMAFVKTTFMKQLENAMEDGVSVDKIVQGFRSMYTIFGKDELLILTAKNYERIHGVNIDLEHMKPGNIMMFNMDMMPMSIFDT